MSMEKNGYTGPEYGPPLCRSCVYAMDRWRESCYCTRFGIILYHVKRRCTSYESMVFEDPEQIRKQENGG